MTSATPKPHAGEHTATAITPETGCIGLAGLFSHSADDDKRQLAREVITLLEREQEIAKIMQQAGIETPGWIEHTLPGRGLVREAMTLPATLMFALESTREREQELVEALKAASEALRSSRHIMGDAYNRELAVELADKCDAALAKHGR